MGTTTYLLNNFGKVSEKTIVGNSTNSKNTYTYNSTTKLLTSLRYDDFTAGTVTNYLYEYDPIYKRLWRTTETGPQAIFIRSAEFDNFGRPLKEFYSAKNVFDGKQSNKLIKKISQNGFLKRIVDDATTTLLWEATTVDEKGQILTAKYGNFNGRELGIENHIYDNSGLPTTISFKTINGPNTSTLPFLSLISSFNSARGILNSKGNNMFSSWDESALTYDNLDRLIGGYKDFSGTETSQDYDEKGRILNNNIGNFKYNISNKPYQNSEIKLAIVM